MYLPSTGRYIWIRQQKKICGSTFLLLFAVVAVVLEQCAGVEFISGLAAILEVFFSPKIDGAKLWFRHSQFNSRCFFVFEQRWMFYSMLNWTNHSSSRFILRFCQMFMGNIGRYIVTKATAFYIHTINPYDTIDLNRLNAWKRIIIQNCHVNVLN